MKPVPVDVPRSVQFRPQLGALDHLAVTFCCPHSYQYSRLLNSHQNLPSSCVCSMLGSLLPLPTNSSEFCSLKRSKRLMNHVTKKHQQWPWRSICGCWLHICQNFHLCDILTEEPRKEGLLGSQFQATMWGRWRVCHSYYSGQEAGQGEEEEEKRERMRRGRGGEEEEKEEEEEAGEEEEERGGESLC